MSEFYSTNKRPYHTWSNISNVWSKNADSGCNFVLRKLEAQNVNCYCHGYSFLGFLQRHKRKLPRKNVQCSIKSRKEQKFFGKLELRISNLRSKQSGRCDPNLLILLHSNDWIFWSWHLKKPSVCHSILFTECIIFLSRIMIYGWLWQVNCPVKCD